MKTALKLFAVLCLAITAACGGQLEQDDANEADVRATLSFDPLSTWAEAQRHADRYAKAPMAVALDAVNDGKGVTWQWTFQGQDRIYVLVAVGPGTVRVTKHESRTYFMGMGVFEPKDIRVDAQDLVAILSKAGHGAPKTMGLSAPLVQKMVPQWTASCTNFPRLRCN